MSDEATLLERARQIMEREMREREDRLYPNNPLYTDVLPPLVYEWEQQWLKDYEQYRLALKEKS